jgi:ABC-2 type transport system permease protein
MIYSFADAKWQLARERAGELDFVERAHETATRNQQLAAGIEQRIAAGEEPEIIPPPWGSRHPGYAGTWSRQPALLPASPLRWLAAGQSDLHLTAFAGPEYAEVSAIGNPLKLVHGQLDLSFIAVYLLPLVIIALSFDLVASERDTGILPLALAQPVQVITIILAKAAAAAGVVAGVTAVTFALGVVSAQLRGEMMERAVLGGAAILVYMFFWFALSLGVNVLGRSAIDNLLLLASAWLAFVVLMPFAIDRVASTLHPIPPISTVIDADREATQIVGGRDPKLMAAFLAHHPEIHAHELSDLGNLYLDGPRKSKS